MRKRGARLGQHFLTARWAAVKLAQAAGARDGVTVVEVGPGKGFLTRELLALGGRVIAIEKDEQLVARLHETFADAIASGQLSVMEGDVRNLYIERSRTASVKTVADARRGESGAGAVLVRTVTATQGSRNKAGAIVLALDEYVVAANIPYYITGEIIRQFLTATAQPRTMALLIQKEVAERIVARGGKESILSLSVKAYGTPRFVAKVGKGSFSPPPSVDSAILAIDNISKEFFSQIDEVSFFKVVHAGFASKRKFLANNLAAVFDKEKVRDAFAQLGIDEKIRAEDVPLETWQTLPRILNKKHPIP